MEALREALPRTRGWAAATGVLIALFLLAPLWSRWPGTVRVVKAK